jgi:predicted nucleic acid-binding protein
MTVVDASVWVSALSVKEVHHEASRRWLAEQPLGLTIPALAIAEIAGALARAAASRQEGKSAAGLVLMTPGLRIVSVDRAVGEAAAEIASQYRLRGADAIYVAVARLLAVPLATLDREMQERAAPIIEIIRP